MFAHLRHVASLGGYEPGDSRIVVVLEFEVEEPFDLVDLRRTDNVELAVGTLNYLNYLLFLNIFVLDLTDEFFEQVFDGH